MEIKIFNTVSHEQEALVPLNPGHLKMYVCGPTVYDRPHLGNARSAVVYDMFFRFFSAVFDKVTYVRNVTDVDDKINKAARERGISIQELSDENLRFFHGDLDALNVLRPTLEPKATDNIVEMVKMIEELIKNGHAYESQGHVLFDVRSYEDYGKLSGRDFDEMVSGARVEVASYKRDPLDFVLWKPLSGDDDVSSIFESPWGKGRPGWHIECSAMSVKYLGRNFDIHGGGADLQFPHHENEIAQSKCAFKGSDYAKYWIHNGFLTVDGEKMSKSLGNFTTVNDLLKRGEKGVVIRYLLLSTHYRKPLDFSEKALSDANKSIEKFYSVLSEDDLKSAIRGAFCVEILGFLAQDLNVAKVFAFLHEKVREIRDGNGSMKAEFAGALDLLGLIDEKYFASDAKIEDEVLAKIAVRKQAKLEKNWALADKIRDELLEVGVALEDKPGGETLWHLK